MKKTFDFFVFVCYNSSADCWNTIFPPHFDQFNRAL